MEKRVEITEAELDKFLNSVQTKRPAKPIDGEEERILIGAYSLAKQSGTSVLDAVKQSKTQAEETSRVQQDHPDANSEAYQQGLDRSVIAHQRVLDLLSESKK